MTSFRQSVLGVAVVATACGRIGFETGPSGSDTDADSTADDGQVLPSCLVGWWKLDDDTGVIATDSSGNGNTGTLLNGPVWGAGRFGAALQFDGVDDLVDIGGGNDSPFDIPGPVSVCAWFNAMSTTDSQTLLAHNLGGGTGYIQYALQINDGQGTPADSNSRVSFIWANGSADYEIWYSAPFVIQPLRWHHLCGVRIDNSTVELYLDGATLVVLSNAASTIPDDGALLQKAAIGMLNFMGGIRKFAGSLDDLRLYRGAITSEGVLDVYGGGPGTACAN